ncbi:hypothetical protein FHS31_000230 [Sphingomonas vulcanisoli]|uniref:DUF4136 domain-containing protein n=1 Tax=Sphingomonas vulcanisoli TaxID=1658060 RepID=A0ABX0TNF7_9SPHN|nr:DUF4136 domain-containing protein [Sphingomonas vulcanisoli]NIJ06648.1 hypothetical protein [Sphingomonas vulcanisoli]
MKNGFLIAGALAALTLAGCTTTPETHVTRFHLDQRVATGQIAVEPIRPADKGSLEFQTYASIVGAELARLGFSEAPGLATSEQVAAIVVERGSREGLARSAPVTVGIGGGNYGWHGGVGGGISFPIGHAKSDEIVMTRLIVQIKRRSDASVVWEGRAETAARAGSPEADPTATVRRLATALFKDFPGASGQTVTVK